MDWNEVTTFRAEHCKKCLNYINQSKEQTGTERCNLVCGTPSSYAIETGKCKFCAKEER